VILVIRRVARIAMVAGALACSKDAPSEPSGPTFDPPVQIAIGQTVGAPTFDEGDGANGGQGQPVHGIACDASEPVLHVHAHLTLIANGTQRAIPLAIGVVTPVVVEGFVVAGSCFYWFHTHDATGIIHLEAPVTTTLTLGDFFAIWGEPLDRSNVAGFQGAVTAFVDSARYDGDLGAIPITEHLQVTLVVGPVPTNIPTYTLPSVF
jgi:hypothetical protein